MQLTTLEIKGFKSFGERTVIHFDEGVTGIVGPNGCGKSNVVDSIRWVLGEQRTRNLRSDKMESVIFNGTKQRRPQQMAEVSLTFRNHRGVLPTEWAEVRITRRYYRSGESEYLLNGVTCRLKDITALFMDSGIGSDSYAIIELSMVDDLLNDRENARRGLFEEAAGVSKFKASKRETLRKLDATRQDLDRVADLLQEIQKNMRQLERQARQAQRYFELRDEYRTAAVALAHQTLRTRAQARQRLEQKIADTGSARDEARRAVQAAEAETERTRRHAQEVEHRLVSRRTTLAERTET
ncbi:MAG: AAA family ATPase, partial [Catalinimonas sp.]